MEALIETLIDTHFGIIVLGIFLVIAVMIEFWNKPKT